MPGGVDLSDLLVRPRQIPGQAQPGLTRFGPVCPVWVRPAWKPWEAA